MKESHDNHWVRAERESEENAERAKNKPHKVGDKVISHGEKGIVKSVGEFKGSDRPYVIKHDHEDSEAYHSEIKAIHEDAPAMSIAANGPAIGAITDPTTNYAFQKNKKMYKQMLKRKQVKT